MPPPRPRRRHRLAALLCAAAGATGCGERADSFQPNGLLRATGGLTDEQSSSIDAALAELFGSPDEPRLPPELPRMAELCDLAALQQAAGPVASHEVGVTQGLYRRHCARCHGVTGDGRGPTARYQSPYPRDFRRGVFKWKSTYRDAPPTVADLDRVLEHGVPGTAMPSFRLLSEEEREILQQYVIYLAIRGQTERALVSLVADELPAGEPLRLEGDLRDEVMSESLAPIVAAWVDAESDVVSPPDSSEVDDRLIARGRDLYHSEKAGCFKCHGAAGQGGAVAGKDYEIDYDRWTRERVVARPSDAVAHLVRQDLPIRPSRPRQLIGATPHGGDATADLYRRVHQGIAGTTMPAVGGAYPGQPGSLTDEEVQSVVVYLQSINPKESPL
ncbi:Cytochrome c [Botrimarina colliarenosi]|uniref:Cytochrome c n=1 Tax=Botrimarina colliarenosi TaxID=2528001 RepID=A0A5C6AJZ7_9BACT|nr:cytochrome c [Botrimarina colliarenosi]TWT99736.1 Cytochrome c [Botrimarina colliarenosi]